MPGLSRAPARRRRPVLGRWSTRKKDHVMLNALIDLFSDFADWFIG
ncbi:hypothetical protein [Streptomyces luteireticuli]